MSVCDEGWGTEPRLNNFPPICPCLDTYADEERQVWKCNLGVFEEHDQGLDYCKEESDHRPDSCRFATILKGLVTAFPEALSIIEAVLDGAKVKQLQKGFFDDEAENSDYFIVEVPQRVCGNCDGSGQVNQIEWDLPSGKVIGKKPCPRCGGSGWRETVLTTGEKYPYECSDCKGTGRA